MTLPRRLRPWAIAREASAGATFTHVDQGLNLPLPEQSSRRVVGWRTTPQVPDPRVPDWRGQAATCTATSMPWKAARSPAKLPDTGMTW